jgi:uncharacterized protein
MRHYAKLLRATLTASLMLAMAGAAVAGPLEDGQAAYQRGDYATALRLLRPLAEQGNATAQGTLGGMYQLGHGVPQNDAEAKKWYRLAAAKGDAIAQTMLSILHYNNALELEIERLTGRYNGQGVPQNYAEALKWSRLAADQGNATAQGQLGSMYYNGHGVPQNYVRAYMWFDLASAQGDQDARYNREQVARLMTPAQIAEAQRLTREYAPSTGANKRPSSRAAVPLKKLGGTFVVPVQINGAITLDFTIDSGAADVSVPADVFSTLMRTGTIRDADIIGEQTYVLADGSKENATTFTIRTLKIGNKVVENVRGSVASPNGSLLLGQSFLERFKLWSIDNSNHELLLEPQ